jgi:uncharacterized sulfatase
MNNVCDNPAHSEIRKKRKKQLKEMQEELSETAENYPHIQKIIDGRWMIK